MKSNEDWKSFEMTEGPFTLNRIWGEGTEYT